MYMALGNAEEEGINFLFCVCMVVGMVVYT